jgi:hypothetical protein
LRSLLVRALFITAFFLMDGYQMDDPLAVYLHDHLAGAASAIDLLESMAKHHASDSLGQFAAVLLVQVQQDRDTLRNVARRIGHSSSGLKDAAAWFAEKVSRLKLNHDSGDGLGTFEALEFLELGIFGKLVMWRALNELATVDPRLQGMDFEQLAARAELQRSKVEERRLDVGRAVFVPAA